MVKIIQWIRKSKSSMKLTDKCFNKVKKNCLKFIKSQETKADKFKNKERMIKSFLIPLCFWISKKADKKRPYFVGLAGGQGTGKTTISSLIKIILTKYFKLKVFRISIDDFYKTRKERINLSKKTLIKEASLLKNTEIIKTNKVVANNTKKSIQSGFYWGYLLAINGLIKKISMENKFKPKIILTGGLANIFKNDINPKPIIRSNLTLEGLQIIGSIYYAKKK